MKTISVAIHYKVEPVPIKKFCLFCSFDECLCQKTFQDLVDGDFDAST